MTILRLDDGFLVIGATAETDPQALADQHAAVGPGETAVIVPDDVMHAAARDITAAGRAALDRVRAYASRLEQLAAATVSIPDRSLYRAIARDLRDKLGETPAGAAADTRWQPDEGLDYDSPPPPEAHPDAPLRTGTALPPAHDGGPTVAEATAHDRAWFDGEKAGG